MPDFLIFEAWNTNTYQELAVRLGDPKAVRAVGTANGRNPIAILIPCHRVIGAGNKLTGYAGGIWRKKILLELEMKHSIRKLSLFRGQCSVSVTAWNGRMILKEMNELPGRKIKIIAAGKVLPENRIQIAEFTGVCELHGKRIV